jgi:hypothetical protein
MKQRILYGIRLRVVLGPRPSCSLYGGGGDWYGGGGVGADAREKIEAAREKIEAGGGDWNGGREGVGADAGADGTKIGAGGGVANAGELLPD